MDRFHRIVGTICVILFPGVTVSIMIHLIMQSEHLASLITAIAGFGLTVLAGLVVHVNTNDTGSSDS